MCFMNKSKYGKSDFHICYMGHLADLVGHKFSQNCPVSLPFQDSDNYTKIT